MVDILGLRHNLVLWVYILAVVFTSCKYDSEGRYLVLEFRSVVMH
jgi:hypothetical protein